MPEPKELECTNCGWQEFVNDDTVPTDWDNHGDVREPIEDFTACASPNMGWVT